MFSVSQDMFSVCKSWKKKVGKSWVSIAKFLVSKANFWLAMPTTDYWEAAVMAPNN